MEEKFVENQNLTVVQRTLQYKKYIIVALGVTALIFLFSFSYLAVVASSSKIYPNVKVMDVNIGGLEKDEAVKKLENYYSNTEKANLILKTGNHQEVVKFDELGVKYDFNKAVENAYNLGSEGGIFKRLFDIAIIELKGEIVELPMSYDSQVLDDKLNKFENDEADQVKDDTYEIKDNRMIVHYGHSGKGIDKESLVKQIEERLKKGVDGELVFNETNVKPKSLDADSILTEPKDASVKIINFSEIKYIPEVYGAEFDKDSFKKLYKENQGKDSFNIPIAVIRPKLTLDDLKSKLFRDTLASYDTYYGSSPQNRKHNIQLAASKIDGVILGPGDEFSYNTIVGPRTADRGFQMAHVYSSGKIIDDFGGGICQVSTTLYDAVLNADLDVTSRQNHMFTVGYAKPGLDATVSYGSVDFKFKNNTSWPIKIINHTTPTDVNFTILGTNTDPEKTIEFRREIVKVLPYNTITTLDPTLPEGKVVTDQAGTDGYMVNVYKITKRGGEVEKEEFMHKDTYQPLDARVRKGTHPNDNKVPVQSDTGIQKIPEQPKIDTQNTLEQSNTNSQKLLDEKPKTEINNQNSNTNSQTGPLEPVVNQNNTKPVEQ